MCLSALALLPPEKKIKEGCPPPLSLFFPDGQGTNNNEAAATRRHARTARGLRGPGPAALRARHAPGRRASAVYAIACAVYLLLTADASTRFADSLTDEQRALKRVSARERMHAFKIGVAVGVLVVALHARSS